MSGNLNQVTELNLLNPDALPGTDTTSFDTNITANNNNTLTLKTPDNFNYNQQGYDMLSESLW